MSRNAQWSERERIDASILVGIPRVVGSPDEVAAEVTRRVLARNTGFVYVGAYLRRRPARTRRHHAKRAA